MSVLTASTPEGGGARFEAKIGMPAEGTGILLLVVGGLLMALVVVVGSIVDSELELPESLPGLLTAAGLLVLVLELLRVLGGELVTIVLDHKALTVQKRSVMDRVRSHRFLWSDVASIRCEGSDPPRLVLKLHERGLGPTSLSDLRDRSGAS